MGFSLVFNIFEAYVKEKDLIISDDTNAEMDKLLAQVKQVLLANGGEYIGREEIKMRICYPNIVNENSNIKSDLFLFNKSNDNVAHVLCRNKLSEEDFEATANEVDNNFLIISEKSRILNFRQIYTIDYQVIKIGDITFKLGSIYKDILNRFIFLEIENPYNSKYDEIREFSYEIVQSLFFPNMKPYCLFNATLEKLYKEEKLKVNQHWDILQYAQTLTKK